MAHKPVLTVCLKEVNPLTTERMSNFWQEPEPIALAVVVFKKAHNLLQVVMKSFMKTFNLSQFELT